MTRTKPAQPIAKDDSASLLPKKQSSTDPGERLLKPYTDARGYTFPQAIAHRGFKSKYPENTLVAFKAAIASGVHALETDLHLTKDGVVVLSHDKTLKRCFGVDKKIVEMDWDEVKTYETKMEPKQHMPRFTDLLEILALPENQHLWVVLDIKLSNNSDDLMRCLANTLRDAPKSERPWDERLMLGIWTTSYLEYCSKHLPSYPIIYIGFSIIYARQFLSVPNVSFNLLQKVLMGPLGRLFLSKCKKEGRAVVGWTVNDPYLMKWCIRKGLDGVITDDPDLFLKVCKEYNPKEDSRILPPWKYVDVVFWNVLVGVVSWIFVYFHGMRIDKAVLKRVQEYKK